MGGLDSTAAAAARLVADAYMAAPADVAAAPRHHRHRRRARELCCMDLLCTTFMDLFELDLYELV